MQFMRRCTERNIWQRFPILTKHFLTQFDQGRRSEVEMAEEIYLLTLEAERDEEISEEELIRTIYQPTAQKETQQDTTPTPDARHQPENQEITKERILELVEEGTWSTEQGREEYGRLEKLDTPDAETTPAALYPTQTYAGDTRDNPGHNAPETHSQMTHDTQDPDKKRTRNDCKDGHDNKGNDINDTVKKDIDTSEDTVAGVLVVTTQAYPADDTRDKETNIPGRNVGLGAPSSIPHQLHHCLLYTSPSPRDS